MENELFYLQKQIELRNNINVAMKSIKFVLTHYQLGTECDYHKIINFLMSIEFISNELKLQSKILFDEVINYYRDNHISDESLKDDTWMSESNSMM